MKNVSPVRLLCPGCKKGLLAFDPATVDSVRCPECNSPYWDKPRVKRWPEELRAKSR